MMEMGEFMMLSSEMKTKEILRSVPLLIPLGEDFTRVSNKAHPVAWNLTLIRMTKDEKGLAFFKGLLL
jgi:hypothetical protein